MKNIAISLFFALFCLHARAQKAVVPGYQGKRFSIEITANYFPAINNLTAKHRAFRLLSDAEETSYGAFNARYEAALSYAIRRRLTLTADYGIGKTGFENSAVVFSDGTSGNGFYVADFKTLGVGLLMHGQRRWGLAPIGPYWGVKVMRTSAKGTLKEVSDPVTGYSWVKLSELADGDISIGGDEDLKDSFFNLGVTFGTKRVLFDKLVLNLGFNVNFVGMTGLIADYYGYEQNEVMIASIQKSYIVNVHVGAGYLF
jgi:hypothetical protein